MEVLPLSAEELEGIEKYYENIPYGLCIFKMEFDDNGVVKDFKNVYVNKKLKGGYYNYEEGAVGKSIIPIIVNSEITMDTLVGIALRGESAECIEYNDLFKRYYCVNCCQYKYGYVSCAITDITDQKMLEGALHSTFYAYETVYYVRIDETNGLSFVQTYPKLGEMEKAIDKNLFLYRINVNDEDFVSVNKFLDASMLKQILQVNDYAECRFRGKIDSSNWTWYMLGVSACERKNRELVAFTVTIKNIDTLVRQEEYKKNVLANAVMKAEQTSKIKTDFITSMSNEIRNPLNVIIGMSFIADMNIENKIKVKECLDKINAAGNQVIEILNKMVEIEAEKEEEIILNEQAFSISEMLKDIAKRNIQLNKISNDIVFKIKGVDHENIIGDRALLEQALVSVVYNVHTKIKPNESIYLTLTEHDNPNASIQNYRLSIKYYGRKENDNFFESVFEPINSDINIRGISKAKKIFEKMGGTVAIATKKDNLYELIIDIPMYVQINQEEENEVFNEKVLVISSSEIRREAVVENLREMAVIADAVNDTKQALDVLHKAVENKKPYTVVLLEYEDEKENGIEITKKIREYYDEDLPIMMMSMVDFSEIETQAVRAGVNQFISKPVFRSDYIEAFRRIADKREMLLSQPNEVNAEFDGIKALVVEDNEVNAIVARGILENLGVSVTVVGNGREAVNMFEISAVNAFDCIFMDLKMPVMNGLDATRTIRAMEREDANIPIFAMTASIFNEDIENTKAAGMQEHIGKPISVDIIRDTLRKWFPQ